MTTTPHHAIKIAASRPLVFKALTDAAEMTAWHVGAIEGEIAVGSTFYLNPKPGLRFGWRTDEIATNERVRQICVEGPGELCRQSDGPWLGGQGSRSFGGGAFMTVLAPPASRHRGDAPQRARHHRSLRKCQDSGATRSSDAAFHRPP